MHRKLIANVFLKLYSQALNMSNRLKLLFLYHLHKLFL